jgi:hypothetical protein
MFMCCLSSGIVRECLPMQADDLASTLFQLPVVLPCESIGAQAQTNTYDRNEQATYEPTVHSRSLFSSSSSSTTRGASTSDSVIQFEIENFIFMSVLE